MQKVFKATLEKLYVYFGYSTRATALLKAVQIALDAELLAILKVAETRWLSMGNIGVLCFLVIACAWSSFPTPASACAVAQLKRMLASVIVALMVEARTSSGKQDDAVGLSMQLSSMLFIQTLLLSCDVLPILTRMSKTFQREDIDYAQVIDAVERAQSELSDLAEEKGEHESELEEFVEKLEEQVKSYVDEIQKQRAEGKHLPGVGSLMEELKHFSVDAIPARRRGRFSEFPVMRKQYIAAVRDNLNLRFPNDELPVVRSLCAMFDPRKLPPEEADVKTRRAFADSAVKTVLAFYGEDKGDVKRIVDPEEVTSTWPSFVKVLRCQRFNTHVSVLYF